MQKDSNEDNKTANKENKVKHDNPLPRQAEQQLRNESLSAHKSICDLYGYSDDNLWEIGFRPKRNEIEAMKNMTIVNVIQYIMEHERFIITFNIIRSESSFDKVIGDGTCGSRACYMASRKSLLPTQFPEERDNITDKPYRNSTFKDNIESWLQHIISNISRKLQEDSNDDYLRRTSKTLDTFLQYINNGPPWNFFPQYDLPHNNQWFCNIMFYNVMSHNNVNGVTAQFAKH